MASLYVHALTDVPLDTWNDGRRRIESFSVEGIFAICERRPESPPISEAGLRRQHAIVQRIMAAAPATLPARFGSLLDEAELATMLRARRELILAALDRVRGCVQMTVRIAVKEGRRPERGVGEQRREPGRGYLEARQRRASPPLPPRARTALEAVAHWVVEERCRPVERLVTVYHLVRREDLAEYEATIADAGVDSMRVTGPWAPFAFVPDLARLRLRP